MNKYKHFCIKLLRNLWHASEITYNNNMSPSERCINLNKWLYFYRKIDPVPKEFIKKVFNIIFNLDEIMPPYKKCKYSPYEEFIESENVVKLSFLTDNISTIIDIIKFKEHNLRDLCLEYIRKCYEIYRTMNMQYCNVANKTEPSIVSLCAELKGFSESYDTIHEDFLLTEGSPDVVIPLLGDRSAIAHRRDGEKSIAESSFLSDPLKSKISTGIAFTPARSWFHGRNRGVKANNFLDEGEINEMFHNNPNFENMESDNSNYNIGYHNMED
ncbi:hypothetical protein PVBG_05821 [Plasmodium vivax Brazil I]|uniref:PIR Superfamily Protein n=1 Tax=Plasmodium vivax (strain Brazil I) TaxID=1033975 RepID=A0A0J9T2S5_PLAV1|nr:hypothetical protein PVBG_05821 [Plasmodium vivax Brazil I]